MSTQPRGIRTHNPGNIVRIKGVTWEGQAERQAGRFVTFTEPKWGIRAICRILITYADGRKAKDGSRIDTVRKIIQRWAPPVENNTGAYAAHVARRLGVGPDEILEIKAPETMFALVESIILHENGEQPYTRAQIEAGMVLAGIEPDRKPLAKTRTVKGGQAAGVGTIASSIAEAVDPGELVAWGHDLLPVLKWAGVALIVAGVGLMIWARIDDRRRGLR